MALFTPQYVDEQKRLHAAEEAYGSRGYYWGYMAAGIARIENCHSVLDYGCGKGTLGNTLRGAGIDCREYDPGVPGKEVPPEPADLVVSVDVMEHIEPDLLNNVLDDLVRLTNKVLFVAISTRLSGRTMSDGRNTHLIVKGDGWWRRKLEKRRFVLRRVWKTGIKEWVAMMNAPRR